MKNLENIGVQELNAREIRETEGGNWIDVLDTLSYYYIQPIIWVGEAVESNIQGLRDGLR
jgi:hypothetical protein